MSFYRLALGATLCFGAACQSAGFPMIVEGRELLPSAGAPVIRRVRDLGTPRLQSSGAFVGQPDGVTVPGELVLLEGDNLGKQPTVLVGGRATSIVARTEGGGIILRVPRGVPSGE